MCIYIYIYIYIVYTVPYIYIYIYILYLYIIIHIYIYTHTVCIKHVSCASRASSWRPSALGTSTLRMTTCQCQWNSLLRHIKRPGDQKFITAWAGLTTRDAAIPSLRALARSPLQPLSYPLNVTHLDVCPQS